MRRMENLVFSLNATVPIFLMMVLGMLFRKLGWMDEEFAAKMNKFVEAESCIDPWIWQCKPDGISI